MQVYCYELIDSTQNQAKKLIDSEEIKMPAIIIADEQSAGRGQYGKSWASPAGAGLYASIVLLERDPDALLRMTDSGFTVRITEKLIAVLNDFYPADYKLKPINDVYYNDCKLAGALVEIYKGFTIIGIGLNIKDQTRQIKEALVEKPKAAPISLEELVPGDILASFDKEKFLQNFFLTLTEA